MEYADKLGTAEWTGAQALNSLVFGGVAIVWMSTAHSENAMIS